MPRYKDLDINKFALGLDIEDFSSSFTALIFPPAHIKVNNYMNYLNMKAMVIIINMMTMVLASMPQLNLLKNHHVLWALDQMFFLKMTKQS